MWNYYRRATTASARGLPWPVTEHGMGCQERNVWNLANNGLEGSALPLCQSKSSSVFENPSESDNQTTWRWRSVIGSQTHRLTAISVIRLLHTKMITLAQCLSFLFSAELYIRVCQMPLGPGTELPALRSQMQVRSATPGAPFSPYAISTCVPDTQSHVWA